jgi:outer membrane immunogenic protein
MKKLLLALAALIAGAAINSVNAADMAIKAPPPPPPEVYSWTGFYVGPNAGYSWGRSNSTGSFYSLGNPGLPPGSPFLPFLVDAANQSFSMDGLIGGGQAGYNWQNGNWLLGLEADIQASGQHGDETFICPTICKANGLPAVVTLSEKLEWFGTVRGRFGITVTPTILLYATGGLAYGKVAASGTIDDPTPYSASATKVGWTAGAGLEGVISGNWSAKLEYLYMDLGSISGGPYAAPTIQGPFGTGFCDVNFCPLAAGFSSHITDNILRLGLNYRMP